MKRFTLAALSLAGCYTGSSATTSSGTLANQSTTSAPLAISSHGLGPINDSTKATQQSLQTLLPHLVVKSTNLSGGSGLVYEVFDHNEQLFYVVPDDAGGDSGGDAGGDDDESRNYATTIFAVFAVSPRIAVEGRDWTIGQPLASAKGASHCECWGDGEVTACFDPGSRLRLIFEDRCDDAKSKGGRAMIGKKIARVMWKVQTDDDQPALDEDRD